MKSISVPSSVTYIGEDAFADCDALTIDVFSGSYAEEYCIKNNLKYTLLAPVKPTSVKLDQNSTVTLNMGMTLQLHATLQPLNAVADSITWKSSVTKYATVNSNGIVTPVAEGTATITVTAKRGSVKKTASVKIRVVDPNKLTGLSLSASPSGKVAVGDSVQLIATLAPATATGTITYKSSSTAVAKVDANGVVSVLKKGTATITATATYKKTKLTKTIKVTVVAATPTPKPTATSTPKPTAIPTPTPTAEPTVIPVPTEMPYQDDFECRYNAAGTGIVIMKYHGNDAHVVIAERYFDLPVVEIGAGAFEDNTSIISVDLPETVEIIGEGAFKNCTKLKEMN